MAVIAVPAWALINCVLAQAITVTAADRTEVRTRAQSSMLRLDAETRPAFRLALTTPRTSYSFGYIPTFTALSIASEDGEIIIQQAADANASFRWEHTIFSVSQSGSYGERNFRALAVAAPAPAGSAPGTPPGTGTTPPGGTGTTPLGGTGTTPPPPTGTPPGQTGAIANAQFRLEDNNVTLATSQTRATLQQVFSARTFGTLSGGYEYGGGIGTESERFLAIRKGPSVTVSVRHRVTPADDLTTVTNGTYLETGSDKRAQMVDLGEQWTHRWSPVVVGSLLIGASAARAESDGFPRRRTSALVPIALASLEYGFGLSGGRTRVASFLQFVPIIDRFTGDFDQRLQWVVDVNWTRHRLSLLANFAGAQSVLPRVVFSLSNNLPFNYYSGTWSVLYRFTHELSGEGGFRAAWVRTEGDAFPLLWSVFVAGTYTLSATYL